MGPVAPLDRLNVALKRGESRRERCATLSIVFAGDEPPTEFRIFTAGAVDTVKGAFVFDTEAASSVMAEYKTHGIDLMIDYDHASLGSVADPALAGRAAGWFNLELRNGELWAVNVRWTPPAAQALRAKEWRFMSPAFQTEGERIVSVMNVAITNLPATRNLEPLMAASVVALAGDCSMLSPDVVSKILEALAAGDGEAALALLKEIVASAAGGEAPADDAEPTDGAPVVPLADDGEEDPSKKEDKTAVAAAITSLTRLTGKTTLGAVVEEVEAWRTEALGARAALKQVAEERAALQLAKRKENAITLTRLGAETPFTSGLGAKTPRLCKRLLDEPLDEQNARVAALLAAKGGKLPAAPVPPSTGGVGVDDGELDSNGLTKRELRLCKESNCDPATFAMLKARRTPKT